MTERVEHTPLDVEAIRADFPILHQDVHEGVPLVYLDSAATSQTPKQVIDAMSNYYLRDNANIHRGIHTLAARATAGYENSRKRLQALINAQSWREVVFVRNTTEAINLVAWTWGQQNIGAGDVILSTTMEHHANIVPWQLLAQRVGAEIRYVPMVGNDGLDLDAYARMLDERVKLVCFSHVSNATGAVQPVVDMVAAARRVGARVLLDAAQSVPHQPVDVQALDVDFMCFSGHKMLGPTGIGVLYGKFGILQSMPPFLGGGDMIKRVTLEDTSYNDVPYKFEAGTPSVAEVIGLGAAVDYLEKVGLARIQAHVRALTDHALQRLREVSAIEIIGPTDPARRSGSVSLNVGHVHPHDVAQILDMEGIAVRAGHHCAQPVHAFFGVPASVRASFYLYNTTEEIDRFVEGLSKVKEAFGV